MNFIRRNKNIIIVLVIFFIGILFCVQLKNMLIPNDGAAVYGNRLDGKVEISKDIEKNIKEKLVDIATDAEIRVSGRIINVTVTVLDEVSRDTAKTYAINSLELFTEEEKAYYDIQFYLVKNNKEATEFPIIGYKIQNSEKVTWTKDR